MVLTKKGPDRPRNCGAQTTMRYLGKNLISRLGLLLPISAAAVVTTGIALHAVIPEDRSPLEGEPAALTAADPAR